MEFMIGDAFMVAWTPEGREFCGGPSGSILVGPWPDMTGWSEKYMLSTGYCDAGFEKKSTKQQTQILRNLFLNLVLGDGLYPQTVHDEFNKLKIWRDMRIVLPGGSHVALSAGGSGSPHIP